MKKFLLILLFLCLAIPAGSGLGWAQTQGGVFDDKELLEGYAAQHAQESKDVLLAMIGDDALSVYRSAAAIRVFREKFSQTIFGKEKTLTERSLLRRIALTDSVFVEIEARYTLCKLDRYRYFESMMPTLLYRMDHYNKLANELSFAYVQAVIKSSSPRNREARIVFNALRRRLFLSRRKINPDEPPDERLKQKIELLRWAVKILGNQELQRLPPEVLNLF